MKLFVNALIAGAPLLAGAASPSPQPQPAPVTSAARAASAAPKIAATKPVRRDVSGATTPASAPKAQQGQIRLQEPIGPGGLGGVSTPPKAPPKTEDLVIRAQGAKGSAGGKP